MAQGASYPAEILDGNNIVRIAGTVTFTDDADQPTPPSLFTGWTSDAADPANVTSNGGDLSLDDGDFSTAGLVSGATATFGSGVVNVGSTTTLGFYGADPITIPTIANAAAADIITALAALGLVIDGT